MHPTIAQIIIALASGSAGTCAGLVLAAMFRSGAEADLLATNEALHDTIERRDAKVQLYEDRVRELTRAVGRAEAEVKALTPDALAHRKTLAQRAAALVKANAANAARKAANVTPIGKRA